MTDAPPSASPPVRTSTPRSDLERLAWPALPEDVLRTLHEAGQVRELVAGDVLFDVREAGYDLVVLLEGAVDIVDRADDHVVVTVEAPNFIGELGMLLGQGTFLAGVAAGPTRALVVPQHRLVQLVAEVPEVGDLIVTAFAARRRLLVEWHDGGLAVLGAEGDAATVRLLEFASRSRLPHHFVDAVADPDAAAAVLAACGVEPDFAPDLPVVVTGDRRMLQSPSVREVAVALGLALTVGDEAVDLLVVGAGPAGLAAAVYGASEGLRTLVLEDTAIGGQAGTSSRIENYLGFATGVAGAELAFQGQIQAVKFGARLAVPLQAAALRREGEHLLVTCDDGTEVRARAVVVASGARYRRLPVPGLERFEGAGVYYAATEMEARFCRGTEAVVVGGGNSAGQAAMFLSRQAAHTHLVVRRDGLADTMSSYLSDRIAVDPRITLHPSTEVTGLHGDGRLQAVTLTDRAAGTATRVESRAVFTMIGAAPNTEWLAGAVDLDDDGFVVTGRDGDPYATSEPGVWAVGDVRSGSTKRVAAAVGEGSVVVSALHRYLGALAPSVLT